MSPAPIHDTILDEADRLAQGVLDRMEVAGTGDVHVVPLDPTPYQLWLLRDAHTNGHMMPGGPGAERHAQLLCGARLFAPQAAEHAREPDGSPRTVYVLTDAGRRAIGVR